MSESTEAKLLHRKMDVEIAKMMAEISKISAETSRINEEKRLHPWIPIVIAVFGSGGFYALVGACAAYFVTVLHH